jgi:methylisocitrate lyase
MARTDAYSVEGFPSSVDRAVKYVDAGADMIFAEAMTSLDEYRDFARQVKAPVLANLTEFGKTPLFSLQELREAGIAMALYPLSAFRAMSAAAENVYRAIRTTGTQRDMLVTMQSRDELYRLLGYHEYEKKLDELFAKEPHSTDPPA